MNCHQYKSFGYMKDGSLKSNADKKTATLEELQAKILSLEIELKKQKEAEEKSTDFVKRIWGDNFENDSLH